MHVAAGNVTELSITSSHRRLEHLIPHHHDATRSSSGATSHNAPSHFNSTSSQSLMSSYLYLYYRAVNQQNKICIKYDQRLTDSVNA